MKEITKQVAADVTVAIERVVSNEEGCKKVNKAIKKASKKLAKEVAEIKKRNFKKQEKADKKAIEKVIKKAKELAKIEAKRKPKEPIVPIKRTKTIPRKKEVIKPVTPKSE